MTKPTDLSVLRARLRTALVSDVLDEMGFREQCLPHWIAPLVTGPVTVGRAFTAVHTPVQRVPAIPYQGLLKALDAVGQDDVFITSSSGLRDVALWGELVSTACMTQGAAGAVIDGLVRDVSTIAELRFPVYAGGAVPYDVNGRMELTDYGCPMSIGGVHIEPGCLVVADMDGVVVVPKDIEEDVVARAIQKSEQENEFRDAVRGGMSASEAFDTFNVL
jgi:4-hydroxy-4-methyl-2-oxoglutarate aldolase